MLKARVSDYHRLRVTFLRAPRYETIQILKRKGFLKKLNIEETNNEKTLEVNNEKVKTET